MSLKKGISLILLVITIIIILIIAGAVIMSLSQNNPIQSSIEAKRMNDFNSYRDELSLYIAQQYTLDPNFNPETHTYPEDITTVIPSMSAQDATKFRILRGRLLYTGTDVTDIYVAQSLGIEIQEASEYVEAKGVNKPKLATGMTAVKWNGSTWETVADPNADTSWYNYDTTNNMWANAKTADGSFWVWIPRYTYAIKSGWHTNTQGEIAIQFSKDTNDNWNSNVVTGTSSSTSDYTTNGEKYTNHPAFTFGTTELTGIWVAKFEASGTTSAINILPGAQSLRTISVDTAFTSSRNMETNNIYGWDGSGTGIDTHLTKNIEWGAVTYLAHSVYGRNRTAVTNNVNTSFYTGGGTGTTYLTTNTNQSTTGNLYGVYDMAGGAMEFVSAIVDDRAFFPPEWRSVSQSSPFFSLDTKYIDVYDAVDTASPETLYLLSISKKGEAIYETSSSGAENRSTWFGYYSGMINYWNNFFFTRGGLSWDSPLNGTFSFNPVTGNAVSTIGFRPTLVISD